MLEDLKKSVCQANKMLPEFGLVILTWGNVSGIDRKRNWIVIKPSGVPYDKLSASDMVVTDLDGKVIEGSLQPSSDLQTHLELYKKFPSIGGVVHTHSMNAVAFAQARMDIPSFGTTHGDYFFGAIPCTREMKFEEISNNYEHNTGKVIVEEFMHRNIDPMSIPGVLVCSHGPFTWGKNPMDALNNAFILETLAHMAIKTMVISPKADPMQKSLLEKHYLRKHGPNAYYGQKLM